VAGVLKSKVTLTAAASGVPTPTVKWQRRAPGATAWKDVRGATSTTLKVVMTRAEHRAGYRAVFTSSAGSATTATATVTLRKARPVITSQPKDVKVRSGARATFRVAFDAYPAASVQWWAKKGKAWVKVSGAHAQTLTVKVTSRSPKHYRVVVKNSQGSVTSRTAHVTLRR
jgi:hypothetical protein